MTQTNLGFGVFVFSLSILYPTLVVAQGGDAEAAKATPQQVACESNGHRWNPETGRCIKVLRKRNLPQAPVTSGGVGGGDCYPGYTYDARRGGCVLYQDGRTIKNF